MSTHRERQVARMIVDAFDAEIVEWSDEPKKSAFVTVEEMEQKYQQIVESRPPVVTWEQPDLFDETEMQKLRSWKSPDALRDMGAVAGRRSRQEQGKPATVEVEL